MSLLPYFNKDILEVGIDEAGRGPLFGRLYVGAVILPQDDSINHSLIKDSKKLSERKRLMVYDYIKDYAIDWCYEYATASEIDFHNILAATHLTMHKAIKKLQVRPQHILVDGNSFPIFYDGDAISHTCIEGGDNKYTPIAAASIIAKVEHDKYINDICDKYEYLDMNYKLRKNKGYGTKQHIEGIKEHGISVWHRKSFGICGRTNKLCLK